ncbi:3060_t:CDS:2 [Acaulospora morrowiae]|uniref:3060_t:CDS:1 n=1 Tax=Acaulospora morrowiae TaxID=94023 RepID=A0A9N9D5C9_9GLOM|nr:3060_t:CDS:2 [Acaulospora morrowiae]
MVLCGELMKKEWNEFEFGHYRCAAHILNIAVNHGMQLQTTLIEKENYITPKIDIITCWNSTYDMLYRFKQMRAELDLLVTKHHFEYIFLNQNEWKQINTIIELHYPILEATILLSSSSYPIISDIRLSFGGILRHLDRFINDELHSEQECMIADSIRYKLNEYWLLLDKSITIAAILDPSSKLTTFLSDEKRNRAITDLRYIMNQYTPQISKTNTTSSKNKKRSFFKLLLEQQQTNELPPEELELYLSLLSCSDEDTLN